MSTAKYISKYEVWLELHDSEVRIYDRNKGNYLLLGQISKNGIERNRNVSTEQSEAIGLLYTTAERYFAPPKTGLNKITAKYVLYGLWLELNNSEVRLYSHIGERYIVVGKLNKKGELTLDNNFCSFVMNGNDNFWRFYEIADRHFSAKAKEIRKQVQEHKLKVKRESIQKALKKFEVKETMKT